MAQHSALEAALDRVEAQLGALGEALQLHQADAVADAAAGLQHALAATAQQLRRRAGPLPAPLRTRLALARGRVAAQRESLARAGAAAERAIDVLLPSPAPRVAYSAAGLSERPARAGALRA